MSDYKVDVTQSQAGGDRFGLAIWKDDMQVEFWGTLQELYDLGELVKKEVLFEHSIMERIGKNISLNSDSLRRDIE